MAFFVDRLWVKTTLLAILAITAEPVLAQAAANANRPVTQPSFPDRPQTERPSRPSVRPPLVRPPAGRPPQNVSWGYHYPSGGRYYAGTVRCESRSGRYRSCSARTQGRVVLERRYNGRCRYRSDWGYDHSRIWVSNNCRATFAYGNGNYRPRYRSNRDDTALIIGGVVVAAGLIAVLSSASRSSGGAAKTFPPQQTASIVADLDTVRASARPALRTCLDKASSNVAATGGSKIDLTSVNIDDLGGGTFRFDADVKASYPDEERALEFSCTAKAETIDDFDFVVAES